MNEPVIESASSPIQAQLADVPLSKGRITAPEEHGQADHEEGMGAEVRSNGKVAVEGRRAHLILHPGEVRRLPADQRQGILADGIPPRGEGPLVWQISATASSLPLSRRTRTMVEAPEPGVRDVAGVGMLELRGRRRRRRRRGITSRVRARASGAAHGGNRSVWPPQSGARESVLGGVRASAGADIGLRSAKEKRQQVVVVPQSQSGKLVRRTRSHLGGTFSPASTRPGATLEAPGP